MFAEHFVFFFNLGEMFIQGGEWRIGGVWRNAVGWVRETLKETKPSNPLSRSALAPPWKATNTLHKELLKE